MKLLLIHVLFRPHCLVNFFVHVTVFNQHVRGSSYATITLFRKPKSLPDVLSLYQSTESQINGVFVPSEFCPKEVSLFFFITIKRFPTFFYIFTIKKVFYIHYCFLKKYVSVRCSLLSSLKLWFAVPNIVAFLIKAFNKLCKRSLKWNISSQSLAVKIHLCWLC